MKNSFRSSQHMASLKSSINGKKSFITFFIAALFICSLMFSALPENALASTSQDDFDAYYSGESYEGADDIYYDYYDHHDKQSDLDELAGSDFVFVISDSDYALGNSSLHNEYDGTEKVRCRVVAIISEETGSYATGTGEIDDHIQKIRVKVKEGKYKGMELIVSYNLSDAWGGGNAPKPAKVGNLVICQFHEDDYGQISGEVVQFGREISLLVLAVSFLVLLTLFGGKRGLRSIIALVVTCVGLVCVMIPAMVHGMNAVLAAVCAGLFAVAVTLTIIYGFTVKTIAAALGAWGGLVMSGIITAIMNATMHMTGLVDDESMYLAQSVGDGSIDLRGILFAAILIGTLGGTIDVGISIASALDELREKAGMNITGVEMMKSGISIGIDIMGASLNTLILSYVGSSIHLLMLFYTYDNPFVLVINDEMIACELLRALAGSVGLLLTVPITSFVAAVMMCKGNFGKLDANTFRLTAMIGNAKNTAKKSVAKNTSVGKKSDDSRFAFRQREPKPAPEAPENLFAKAQQHYDDFDDILPEDNGESISDDEVFYDDLFN